MDEITLSRNYRALWADARKKNTFEALERVFDDMAAELGIPDPERDTAQATAGSELAKLLNNRGKGPEAKKL